MSLSAFLQEHVPLRPDSGLALPHYVVVADEDLVVVARQKLDQAPPRSLALLGVLQAVPLAVPEEGAYRTFGMSSMRRRYFL